MLFSFALVSIVAIPVIFFISNLWFLKTSWIAVSKRYCETPRLHPIPTQISKELIVFCWLFIKVGLLEAHNLQKSGF